MAADHGKQVAWKCVRVTLVARNSASDPRQNASRVDELVQQTRSLKRCSEATRTVRLIPGAVKREPLVMVTRRHRVQELPADLSRATVK